MKTIDLSIFVLKDSSQVKWAEYINNIVFPPNFERKITDEDKITCPESIIWGQQCGGANCFDYLEKVRALVNSSTRRIVANYIGWR